MSVSIGLPKELCCVPKPYIVLTGLDVTFNAVHKSIWDAFSNNRRADRLPISFQCLPGDHVYSRSKLKRSSYDWYIPKGILKSNWMAKHLHEIPSVVVVFFELDWDDPAWRERHLECASRVQVVRTSLQGRGSKVAVVLVQKSPPLPPGEDMVAAERAAALCSACDLSAKSLFVLPHTDHLLGYIIRLENAFFELAQTYYLTEARRVKAHKEFLNKTTHQLLFPRHQFKIAFFSEIKQDSGSAVKHYRQSYTHIHELRSHDTNIMEVKVVGGYVNYKICKLCFLQLNAPLDAINQFQSHIDQFKQQCGREELLFEHSTWLSQQYLLFADLFNEAIEQGLSAIPTQHPGFYYQQAAHYASLRKRQSLSIHSTISDLDYPASDPLATEHLEFYGQRPWRQGQQCIDPPSAEKEKDGVLALQKREAEQDHCWIIIPLLSSAISQFKKFPSCVQRKSSLMILMATEYYHAKEYSEAVALLKAVCPIYRGCRWCLLLSHILFIQWHCAYMLADLELFCACSVEMMGCYSALTKDEKSKVQMNLDKFISGRLPQPISFQSAICPVALNGKEALKSWSQIDSNERCCHLVVNNFLPFIECKARFTKTEFSLDQCIQLEVFSRVTCPFDVELSQLWITFSNSVYDKSCIVTNTGTQTADLFYKPWEIKRHVFEFPVLPDDCHKNIQIESVSVKLGRSETGSSLILRWSHEFDDSLGATDVGTGDNSKWRDITSAWSSSIVERESELVVSVTHDDPVLSGEVFPLNISVLSKERELLAKNILVIISLLPGDESLHQSSGLLLEPSQQQPIKTLEFQVERLGVDESYENRLYLVSGGIGTIQLSVRVSYQVAHVPVLSSHGECLSHITCTSCARLDVPLDVVPAYNFTAHVTSLKLESIASAYVDAPFLLLTSLTARSPWPVEIISVGQILPHGGSVRFVGEKKERDRSIELSKDESFVDCASIALVEAASADAADLGRYIVRWRRVGSEMTCATSKFKLPSIAAKTFPVSLSIEIPSCAELRKSVSVKYKVENRSNLLEVVKATYSPAESFMFSGPTQIELFLPPSSSQTVGYNLIPLALGYQVLPTFHITSIEIEGADAERKLTPPSVESYLQHATIPTNMFVKPAQIGPSS